MSDPVALKARFERLHDFWNGAFDVSLNEDSRIRPRIYGLFVGSVADRSIVARRQGAVVRGNRRIDDAPGRTGRPHSYAQRALLRCDAGTSAAGRANRQLCRDAELSARRTAFEIGDDLTAHPWPHERPLPASARASLHTHSTHREIFAKTLAPVFAWARTQDPQCRRPTRCFHVSFHCRYIRAEFDPVESRLHESSIGSPPACSYAAHDWLQPR